VKFRGEPMFTLHQINAFEDGGFLVMDMCCGDDGTVIGDFTLDNLRGSGEDIDKVLVVPRSTWCVCVCVCVYVCVCVCVCAMQQKC